MKKLRKVNLLPEDTVEIFASCNCRCSSSCSCYCNPKYQDFSSDSSDERSYNSEDRTDEKLRELGPY